MCYRPIYTSVNALSPSSDEVKMPVCEMMDDAVILIEKKRCLPITKEYVLPELKMSLKA